MPKLRFDFSTGGWEGGFDSSTRFELCAVSSRLTRFIHGRPRNEPTDGHGPEISKRNLFDDISELFRRGDFDAMARLDERANRPAEGTSGVLAVHRRFAREEYAASARKRPADAVVP